MYEGTPHRSVKLAKSEHFFHAESDEGILYIFILYMICYKIYIW